MDKYALKELSPKQSFYKKYVKPNANIDVERFKYLDWIKFFDDIRDVTSANNAGSILKRL